MGAKEFLDFRAQVLKKQDAVPGKSRGGDSISKKEKSWQGGSLPPSSGTAAFLRDRERILSEYNQECVENENRKVRDWADRYNQVVQGVYAFNEKRGNRYTQDAGGGFGGEITSLIQGYNEIAEYAGSFGLTDGERYVKNLQELEKAIRDENQFMSQFENEEAYNAYRQRPPASNSEQTDWEQAEQLVSPAFFDKMLGNEMAGWDQGGLEADALVSPEFLYRMLERATNNRNQKEQEFREYNQNFHTPTDSTGRRLTYQEMRNGGNGWGTPGSQYYLENQTLGSLAGDEGKAYIQGLQEKKKARNEARQEADQATGSVTLYEDYLKQFGSQDAYRIYLQDLQANTPGAALVEADFENAEAEEKAAQAEYERFINDEPLGTGWWTSRGVPKDQAEYMVQQEYIKAKTKEYMDKRYPQRYAEELAKQDYEKAKKEYDEGVRERYKAKEDAESYAEGRRNLKHNRELLEADKNEIDSMTESEKEAFLNYVRMRDRDGESLVPFMNAPRYNQYVEQFSGKYDIARLEELRESYHRLANAEITQEVAQKSEEWGHAGGTTEGAAYLGTFPAKLVGSVSGTVDSVKGLVFGTGRYKGVDPNGLGNLPNVYADNVRGAIGQDIRGDGSSWFRNAGYYGFQAVNGAGDSLLRAVTAGHYSLALSASATFNDTLIDATKKGASTSEAVALGVLNAGIEVATEKIPLDNLLDNLGQNPGDWWNILMKAGGQGLTECSTEELSFIGTTLVEAAILRQNSSYATTVRELRESGLSEQEAIAKANLQVLEEAKEIAIISMLSGEMSSVGSDIIGAVRNPNTVTPPDVDVRQETGLEQTGVSSFDLEGKEGQPVEMVDTEMVSKNQNTQEIAQETNQIAHGESDNGSSIRTQLRNNLEQLNSMKPVAEIQTPQEFSTMNLAQKMNWVIGKLKPTNFEVERKGIGTIKFTPKQLKSAFNYFKSGDIEEAAFEAIPYVLENGMEISGHTNHKSRDYGTITIAAPVTINGKRGNMAVVVKQTTERFYKVHRILAPDGSVFLLSESK